MRRIFLAAAMQLLPVSAMAAEVALTPGRTDGAVFVSITGDIEKGDLQRVKKASAQAILQSGALEFLLNSAGGDVEEAIAIGEFAREMLAGTYVYGSVVVTRGSEAAAEVQASALPMDAMRTIEVDPGEAPTETLVGCASACVLIFFGGVERYVSDNHDFRLGFAQAKSYPTIGLHRPYYIGAEYSKLSPADAEKAYMALEQEVRVYLAKMGAPVALIDRMFEKASYEIDEIPSKEFEQYYKTREPFFEEWVVSKCGAPGPVGALDARELQEWTEYDAAMRAELEAGTMTREAMDTFGTDNVSAQRYKSLYDKVMAYNSEYLQCSSVAALTHQYTWAQLNSD
jgi:hypothetical protein